MIFARVLAFTSCAILLSACAEVRSNINAPLVSGDTGSVAILPLVGEQGDEIAACVRSAIQRTYPKVTVMGTQEFRDLFYPWFEPSTMPEDPKAMELLLKRPLIQRRIQHLCLQYLLTVGGATETKNEPPDGGFPFYVGERGIMMCGAGPGGGGCLGFVSPGDRATHIVAQAYELQQCRLIGNVEVEVEAPILVPAFIVPVPIIPPTQTVGCADFALELGQKLGWSPRPPAAQEVDKPLSD